MDTPQQEPKFAYDAEDTKQREVSADERQYAIAWHAVAQTFPTVHDKARGGVARALIAGEPTFTVDVDGRVVELDLTPARAKFAELVTQVATEEMTKAKADEIVTSKEASGLALRKSKLDAELEELGQSELKKTPSLWPNVVRVSNQLIEIALAQEAMRITGVLGVDIPWLTGLPATLQRAQAASANAPERVIVDDPDDDPTKPLEIGETVMLKSGGPKMSVASQDGDANDPNPNVTCMWFSDQSTPQRYQFKRSLLRRA